MVDVGSTEPFLEAYSSVMIMSIISSHAYFSVYNLDGSVNEFTNSTKNNFEVVFNTDQEKKEDPDDEKKNRRTR